jgi:hypothetical protein
MNPMVTQTPETPIPVNTAISRSQGQNSSLLMTPRSSVQLRRALHAVPNVISQDPTVRLLFRKIGCQLDSDNFEIERQRRTINILELEKEEFLPKKRKKVIYNGNAEFAKVPAILKAHKQMRKVLQPERTSNRVRKLKLDDLCTQFYLNIH